MQVFICFCENETIRNTIDEDNRGFNVSFVNWRKAICFVWKILNVSLNGQKSIRMQVFICFCENETIWNTSNKDNRCF